jgi:hypothetical protein
LHAGFVASAAAVVVVIVFVVVVVVVFVFHFTDLYLTIQNSVLELKINKSDEAN